MSNIHTTALPQHIPGNDARQTADHSQVAPGEIAIGVIIGRASEYFDFFVFGIAAVLVFPSVFFPFANGLNGTLYAFTIFAFAFVARPIGSVAFMAIQKRFGRETKLTVALFLLGISTAGIAFLPSYGSLGFTAIVLLSIFRVGQGIALGGSWDGLPSLLALNAPEHRRGWFAMLGQIGAPVGFIIASGLFSFLYSSLSLDDFLEWGWRYPFYVAFAINVVALFARLRLVATHEYARLLDERELEPTNVIEMARTQGSTVLIGAFAALASYAFDMSIPELYSPLIRGGTVAIASREVAANELRYVRHGIERGQALGDQRLDLCGVDARSPDGVGAVVGADVRLPITALARGGYFHNESLFPATLCRSITSLGDELRPTLMGTL